MKKILNTGWISFVLLGLVLLMTFWLTSVSTEDNPNPVSLFFVLYLYTGAIVGNAFRIYGMPDAYFTDGTLMSNIKTRLYWNHGPQLIGMMLSPFVWLFLLGVPEGT